MAGSVGLRDYFIDCRFLLARVFADASEGSPSDYKTILLVRKYWHEIATSKEFYQEMYPRVAPHLFGKVDYLKYIGGDSGEEPPIPLKYLVMFEKGVTLLTYAPKRVKFPQPDGTVSEVERSLNNMGMWTANAKEGEKIGFHEESFVELHQEEGVVAESHWSFVNVKLAFINEMAPLQEEKAAQRGGVIANRSDLCLSLLMAFVKTGKRHIPFGADLGKLRACVMDTNRSGRRISIGFSYGGIKLSGGTNRADKHMGVVVAW